MFLFSIRSISTTSSNVNNSILVLDTPGFQNPATCGRLAGATFEEMCHNYVQARKFLKLDELF
jgi:myosin-18